METTRVVPDQLSVVLRFTHQREGEDSNGFDAVHSRILETEEQPYSRKLTIGEEWKEVDFGWLTGKTGFVVIQNTEGLRLRVNQSDDEKADTAKRIIRLVAPDVEDNCFNPWLIHPYGGIHAGTPTGRLRIRCQHDTARYTLTVIPR